MKKFTLYKIYYDDTLVYIGRTKQELSDRIRAHVFKNPRVKMIDIERVSKIEKAEFDTEADMNLYEIYYINKFKPCINKDDKAKDVLTVELPECQFEEWTTPLWEKWRSEIAENNMLYLKIKKENEVQQKALRDKKQNILKKYRDGIISKDEYASEMMLAKQEYAAFQFENNLLTFEEYKNIMGFYEAESVL